MFFDDLYILVIFQEENNTKSNHKNRPSRPESKLVGCCSSMASQPTTNFPKVVSPPK